MKSNSKIITYFMFASLISSLSLTHKAIAQDGLMLEEVVVTAQRREQSLQNVPISISAFTTEAIDKFMFNDVGDYIIRSPNASFTTDGAKSRRRLSIRGVTDFLAINNPLKPSTFGFYVDDFSVSASTSNPPIFDIERIEILRGPQATYFGQNALGGGISVTSKKADATRYAGEIMFDYSNFDTRDVEVMGNVPVIKDVLAVRANIKYSQSDGNIKNINPACNCDGNASKYQYGKLAIRYTPTHDLTVDVVASIMDEEVGMREGVPTGVFSTFAGGTLFANLPDTDGDGAADPTPDGVGFYPDNRTRVNSDFPQDVGTAYRNIIGRIDYDIADLRITSITGTISSDFSLAGDIDGSSIDAFREFRNIERQSFSTELRIKNTDAGRWQWNIGAIYADNDATIWNRTFARPGSRFPPQLIDSQDDSASADSWALFGEGKYAITDRLTASIGGRYSEEIINTDIAGFSGGFVQVLSAKNKFKDFSPHFSANYQFTDEINAYATISRGFKSGGTQISPLPGTDADFYDPEIMWNYELGVKGDFFNDRLRVNAALFYMQWSDLQTNFQQSGINADGEFELFAGTDNAESATSKGVELVATALLIDNLIVNFNVGYLNAQFDKFVTFIDGMNRTLDGTSIPLSPKWTVSADAEYTFPVMDGYDGFARVEYSYRHQTKTLIAGLIQEGFPWREHKDFTLVAYAENLFDEKYYTNAYQKAFAGGLFAEPSFRSYGVRINYTFDKPL